MSILLIAMFPLLTGCLKQERPVEMEKQPGPKLVSSSPADGDSDLVGEVMTVKLDFDQNIKCPSDQQARITINDAVIGEILPFMNRVTIEISGLQGDKAYTLIVPAGTVQGYKSNQEGSDEIRISFSMASFEPYVPSELDPVKTLSNPNASQQAKNVYGFLLEQSGVKTLSGVQSSHSNRNDFVDAVFAQTGKHPALAGFDFIFTHYSPTPEGWSWVQDYNDISAAKEQWENNGLVSYMWHWNAPSHEFEWWNALENYGEFNTYAFYSNSTSFDIKEALKEGTWQNQFIMKDIEEIAGYLQLLEDEGIPVIWRPLHEAAGNYDVYGPDGAWFWWGRGGAKACKALWRLLYDQLVNVYGLDNLIWVWTVDVTPGAEDQYLDWYPGDEYVDILGVDIYAADTDAKSRQYQALVDLTKGKKLVTVSECGNIPDPAKCIDAGNKWSWFMVWPNSDDDGNIIMTPSDDNFKLNTAEYWKKVISSPYVTNREDMPDLSSGIQ